MARDADGVVFQEDFVQELFVPGGARGPAAGVGWTWDHDLVFDCVAAFCDSGFRCAHFLGGLLWWWGLF